MVFRGTLDGRPVAVKRMLPAFFELANREIHLLQENDWHPNIIRYLFNVLFSISSTIWYACRMKAIKI